VWAIVTVVVVGSIVAVTSAYLLTRSCTPGGGQPAYSGVDYCPSAPPPPPTTLIANGTVFTVSAGQYDSFQFQLSPATYVVLVGSFTTTHGGSVFVMTPAEFTNFSLSGVSSFQCPPQGESCFSTGDVSAGTVNISVLPVYRSPLNGVTIEPWFLVMVDSNSSESTNVTWLTNLTATYVAITASYPTTVSESAALGHWS
jgi:hypothetical protein